MAITKLQPNAIPSGTDFTIQLTDGSVVTADIADSNVTTAKIADANVTHAKLHTDMDLSGKTVTLPDLSQSLSIDGVVTVDRVINATTSADPWLKGVDGSNTETSFVKQSGEAYFGGDVGIGTDTPGQKLEVNGGNIAIEHTTGYGLYIGPDATGFSSFGGNASTIHMKGTDPSGGNVARAGALRFESGDGQDTTALYSTTGTDGYGTVLCSYVGDLKFSTSALATYRMVIKNDTGNVGIGTTDPLSPLHIEPSSGNADVRIKRYATGDDARIFVQRKDNTGRAYLAYTNIDTSDTWYTGLLRNNNNNLVLGSRSDDYSNNSVNITNDHTSLHIGAHGSSNPDTTDTSTHQKIEIRANGTADTGGAANYKRDCFVQHTTGYVQYHWYKLRLGSAVYGRGANIKYTANWTTGHASGTGLVDGSFIVRANHGSEKCEVYGHTVYSRQYVGGSYYGWTEYPDITLFASNATQTQAGVYFRVEGYRSSGYDMALVHSLYVEIFGSPQNIAEQGISYVGSSTPSDVGGSIGRTILS